MVACDHTCLTVHRYCGRVLVQVGNKVESDLVNVKSDVVIKRLFILSTKMVSRQGLIVLRCHSLVLESLIGAFNALVAERGRRLTICS